MFRMIGVGLALALTLSTSALYAGDGLSAADVKSALKEKMSAFGDCAELGAGGTLKIKFTIKEDGKVKSASISDMGTVDKAVAKCVGKTAMGLRFPESSGETKVTLPIEIQADGVKEPELSGEHLTPADIKTTFRAHLDDLKACGVVGAVKVKLTVRANGKTKSVSFSGDNLDKTAMKCLAKAMGKMPFPESEGETRITMPLEFKAP